MSRGKYSRREVGGNPWPAGVDNGRIPLASLRRCETQPHLTGPAGLLYPPAARAFDRMAEAAKTDGMTLRLVVGYRDYATQVVMKKRWTDRGKPGYAAAPGTSNHGWGVAADVKTSAQVIEWLKRNAVRYGWDWPEWAQDGAGVEEPWHIEYIQGFEMPEDEKALEVLIDGKPAEVRAVLKEGVSYVSAGDLAKALGWPSPGWMPPKTVNIRTKD